MNDLPKEPPDATDSSPDNLKDVQGASSAENTNKIFSSRWFHVLMAGILELAAGGAGYALTGFWLKALLWPIISWSILLSGYLLKLDTFVYLASGAGLFSFPLLGWLLAHAFGFLYGSSVLLMLGIPLKMYTVTDAMIAASRKGTDISKWKRILLISFIFFSLFPIAVFSMTYRITTVSEDDLWVDRGETVLVRRAVPNLAPWVNSASLHLKNGMVVMASDEHIYRLLAKGPKKILMFSTSRGFAFRTDDTVIRPQPFSELCLVSSDGSFRKCRFMKEARHIVAYPLHFACSRVENYTVPPSSWLSMPDWRTCRTPVKILDEDSIIGRPVLILWSGTLLSPAWERISIHLMALYEPASDTP